MSTTNYHQHNQPPPTGYVHNGHFQQHQSGPSAEYLNEKCKAVLDRWDQEEHVRLYRNRRKRAKLAGSTYSTKSRSQRSRLPGIGHPQWHQLRAQLQCLAPNWTWGSKYIHLERGLLHLLHDEAKYKEMRHAIETIDFLLVPRTWYLEIEEFWHYANYNLYGGKPVDLLTPVNRYRIRNKHPSPNQNLTGGRRYKISYSALEILKSVFHSHPRPSRELKLEMVERTGLHYETVTNWFKNKRQRRKKRNVSESQTSCASYTSTSSSLASSVASSSTSSSPGSSCVPFSQVEPNVTLANNYYALPEAPQYSEGYDMGQDNKGFVSQYVESQSYCGQHMMLTTDMVYYEHPEIVDYLTQAECESYNYFVS